ncbi:hypothetical protein ES703_71992 [subsurface metagenome]
MWGLLTSVTHVVLLWKRGKIWGISPPVVGSESYKRGNSARSHSDARKF